MCKVPSRLLMPQCRSDNFIITVAMGVCVSDNFIIAVAMGVCASDNFIIVVAMDVCASDNFVIVVAMRVCASDNFIIAVTIAVLRMKQSSFRRWQMLFARLSIHCFLSRKHHWRPVNKCSPFANSSLMVKQLRKSRCKNPFVSASQENRRGVLHTPWCERKWNDSSEQSTIV